MNGNDRTPGSMLEVYMHALASRTGDDFLDTVNLGIGNYSEAEYWQQVSAFRRGLYADSAMTEKLMRKAKREALRKVVEAVFDDRDRAVLANISNLPEKEDGQTKSGYYDEHAEDIWRNLGSPEDDYSPTEHKAWLVSETTGIPRDWTPPHWRMLKMRHEASRSKEARLIDNLFGRPPEPGNNMQMVDDFQ